MKCQAEKAYETQICFYWRIIFFHIWFVMFRDREKEEGVPDAHAAKLNAKFLGLSNGFGFIPVFGLVVLWVEFNNLCEETVPYLQDKEPHKPLV